MVNSAVVGVAPRTSESKCRPSQFTAYYQCLRKKTWSDWIGNDFMKYGYQ
jgi:hypothetical protein